MSTPTNPINRFTPFLPSTYNLPEEQDRWKEWLGSNLSDITDVINDKKIGAYTQDAESFNGNKFIYDTVKRVRTGYQSILRVTSFVPGTFSLPVDNVNPQFIISHVWGSASKPCSAVGVGDGNYFSFHNQGDVRIQFTVSDTQIVITTNGTTAGYNGFIFIEYIRDGS